MIITKQAKISYDNLPQNYSHDIIDFVNRLIQRKPNNRLGKNSIKELIEHPWFNDFNWDGLLKKNINSPYVINEIDNYDKKYCLANEKIGEDTLNRYKLILKEYSINDNFKLFNSVTIPEELKIVEFKKLEINNSNNKFPTSRNKKSHNINRDNYKSKSNLKNISFQDSEINKISISLFEMKTLKKLKRNISNLNETLNSIVKGKKNIFNLEKQLFNSKFSRNNSKFIKENTFNLTKNEKLYQNKNNNFNKSKSMSIINVNNEKKLPFIHLSIPKKKNGNEIFYNKLNQHINGDNKKRISKIYNNSIINKSLNSSRNFFFNKTIDKKSNY